MSRFYLDPFLLIPAVFLSLIGLTILRSVAPALFVNQLIFIIVSVGIFLIVSQTDYQAIFTLYPVLYFFSLIFLLSPFLFGLHSRGALRWLQFGQFSLQPSEIVKPILLLTFAALVSDSKRRGLVWLVPVAGLPLLIIFYQPDLGTTLVLLVGLLTSLLSHIRLKSAILGLLAIFLLLLPFYEFVLHDYQKQRLSSFLNPSSDPLGRGYHLVQSLIAVGSGQLLGRGLGHGTQSQLRFLPEHHTDFIFASLSEELGLIGSLVVLGFFVALLRRIYTVSQNTSSQPASIFCLSVVALLTFQIFVNIGMNIGLVPVTGITLPFLSYGGSSLLSLGITLGLVNSVSAQNRVSLI